MLATQAQATKISSVEITDITAPVANSALDTSAACSTTGVSTTAPTVTWTPSATKAGYSTEYTASVTLAASADYEFATDVTATVNGNTASATNNSDGTITVTYTFPATAAAPTEDPKDPDDPKNAEDPKTPEYKITAGAGGTHTLNSDGTLQITCSGALDKLTGIYVDETKLAATNYELVSGSTVLTLKAEYLNTISVGTHKLKFAYSDGSAETTFVINETSEEGKTTEAPQATTETPQATTETTTTPQTTVTPNATTGTTTTSANTAATPDTGDFTPIDLMLVVLLLSGLLGAYFITAGLKQRKRK
jgi:hypothetical protein